MMLLQLLIVSPIVLYSPRCLLLHDTLHKIHTHGAQPLAVECNLLRLVCFALIKKSILRFIEPHQRAGEGNLAAVS